MAARPQFTFAPIGETNGGNWNVDFQSWGAFVDQAGKVPSTHAADSHNGTHSFTGTSSFDAAVSMARDGWHDQADRINKLAERITAVVAAHIIIPTPAYSTEGITFDVGRMIDGEPEHWMYWNEDEQDLTTKRGNVCRIAYNIATSAGVDGRVMAAKGAAIAALCKALDLAGIPAEVDLFNAVSSFNGHKSLVTVVLKRGGQDIDFPLFAFALAHPSTLRRLIFAIDEQAPDSVRRDFGFNGGYYGMPDNLPEQRQKDYDIIIERSMLGEPQWTDENATVAWVLDQLKAQGVHIAEDTRV